MEKRKMEYGEMRDQSETGDNAAGSGRGPVHSQVRKIKQESEKIMEWSPGHPEIRIRPLLRDREINRLRQLSRSPLGTGIAGRPISVGDSLTMTNTN